MRKLILVSIFALFSTASTAATTDCRTCFHPNDFGRQAIESLAGKPGFTVVTNSNTRKTAHVRISLAPSGYRWEVNVGFKKIASARGSGDIPDYANFVIAVQFTDGSAGSTYGLSEAIVSSIAARRITLARPDQIVSHSGYNRGNPRSGSTSWTSTQSYKMVYAIASRVSRVRTRITITGCAGTRCRRNN